MAVKVEVDKENLFAMMQELKDLRVEVAEGKVKRQKMHIELSYLSKENKRKREPDGLS